MNQKKQPFILDENVSSKIKEYLPRDARTTVECGLRRGAPDNPDVIDLCQRENAILVTKDIEFPKHFQKYQRSHNECCWGLLLLPDDELAQIEILTRLKNEKLTLKHPRGDAFHFEDVRWDNLFVNLRATPPQISELCSCEWAD